jgi:hypothetical protein
MKYKHNFMWVMECDMKSFQIQKLVYSLSIIVYQNAVIYIQNELLQMSFFDISFQVLWELLSRGRSSCGFLYYVVVPLHSAETHKDIIIWQFMIFLQAFGSQVLR